jgi:hypothetical protein
MPLDQNCIAVRILFHRRLQALPEILLVRRVLDNRNPQTIIVAKIALLAATVGDAFDLLDLFDFEACVGAKVALDNEGHEDSPLRVRVNAAACAALERGEEERGACGGFEDLVKVNNMNLRALQVAASEKLYLGFAEVLLAVEVHHKHVRRLHEFLLHAAGRNVDLVFMANASSSASSCHLANSHVSPGFCITTSPSRRVHQEGKSYPT